jgi:acetyl esterase/lipase
MTDDPVSGVRLEARIAPFPKSISPVAQAFLQALVGPDGVPHSARRARPAPDDLVGWAEAKAATAEMLDQMMAPLAAKLQSGVATIDLGGTVTYLATPPGAGADDRAYLNIHGGGLVHGGGGFCQVGARKDADLHGVRCYAVDYRMPPEHPYPASLDDCVAAYRALLDRYVSGRIVIGGGSAGGNLAAATVLRARDEGLPLPAAVVLTTPEVDLTESGDSFETNQLLDVMLPNRLMNSNLLYAAGHDLSHPYLSPLFGDFSKGFAPTFLQAGTRDLFLSNTVRMHRALRRAGVPVELHIFEGMPHGGFGGAPEDLELAEEIRRFVAEHWAA